MSTFLIIVIAVILLIVILMVSANQNKKDWKHNPQYLTTEEVSAKLGSLKNVNDTVELIAPKTDHNMKSISMFYVHEKGVAFQVFISLNSYFTPILFDEIEEVRFEAVDAETKKKSVLGRAIIGGVLLGPLGAVVGGISGVGDKKINAAYYNVHFKFKADSYIQYAEVNVKPNGIKVFFDYFSKFTPESKEKQPSFSAADELLKYKQLLDSGAITQEEFDTKKKTLI